jgi:hypothetical protein
MAGFNRNKWPLSIGIDGRIQRNKHTAGELGLEMVKAEIEEAVGKLSQSNQHLEKALKAM